MKWSSAESGALFEAFASAFTGVDRLDRMIGLAELMQSKGLLVDAARLSRTVLAECPEQSLAGQRARRLLGVPRWYYSVLHDHVRLAAYERAIRATVKPGSLVLDIGTGSGILAMIAARAGAALVVACERNVALAQVAETIVARNGLSDRIRIVAGESSALRVGVELPRRADLAISEVLGVNLLDEGILPTMAAARGDLLAADAPSVPRRGSIYVALVQADKSFPKSVDAVMGFDLRDFNITEPPFHDGIFLTPDALLSDAAELCSVDLTGRDGAPDARSSVELRVSRAGAAVGVLLSTAPQAPPTSWGQCFTAFDAPLSVAAGQAVTVHGWRSRDQLLVWV
jgi:predicted nicotinamide N-methyase